MLTGGSQVSAMHIHIHIIPSNKDGIFPPQISRVICHQSFIGALSEIGQVSVSLLVVEAFYVDTYPLLSLEHQGSTLVVFFTEIESYPLDLYCCFNLWFDSTTS